jgi:hypothetical protein
MRHRYSSQLNLCLGSDILGYRGSDEELEANAFSAHLLMPGKYLRDTYTAAPSLRLIKQIAHELVTSLTATAVRIVETTDDPCMVVFTNVETECVHWWRRSTRCPPVWLESRQRISELSSALETLRMAGTSPQSESVNPSAWFRHIDDHEELVVYEESVKLGNYPVLITLLSVARQ